jgi:hypothetical protein
LKKLAVLNLGLQVLSLGLWNMSGLITKNLTVNTSNTFFYIILFLFIISGILGLIISTIIFRRKQKDTHTMAILNLVFGIVLILMSCFFILVSQMHFMSGIQ